MTMPESRTSRGKQNHKPNKCFSNVSPSYTVHCIAQYCRPTGEATSGFPLQVYGTVLLNALYNTALTNIEDIPLFVGKRGSDPSGNDKNFAMTARQSRLGFRFRGTEVAGAKLSGQVEIDFLGGKAPSATALIWTCLDSGSHWDGSTGNRGHLKPDRIGPSSRR